MTDTKYMILHSEETDSIVIADAETHDDIAEVFHCDRHTVNQTAEQALATAQKFAASAALYEAAEIAEWALEEIIDHLGDDLGDSRAGKLAKVRAALALARGEA